MEVRRQVIRRVRYASNLVALQHDAVPPEGPLDVAITNGLLAIVAYEDAAAVWETSGQRLLPASRLIPIAVNAGRLTDQQADALRETLTITQSMRHGRADDEWIGPTSSHLRTVEELDRHPALRILRKASETPTVNELLVHAFREAADEYLWGEAHDPKNRSGMPDPEPCDDCGRETFIVMGWDDFGGTISPGFCLACGYERSEAVAHDLAVSDAIRRAVERTDDTTAQVEGDPN